jgi:LacI family transcriptional regulator
MLLAHGDDRRTTAQVNLRTELVIRDSTGPAARRQSPGPQRHADPGDVVASVR